MDQVYWDILKQSVQIESERLGKEIGQQIGEQKAKEAKLKEAVRLVNQLLKTGTMSFEQIFSIVTNGYLKEEKASVLAAFQSIT